MRLLFIRHGDPNYELDALTEKGRREAELLSKRVAKWHITECFVSPLGRARETANIALKETSIAARECGWLREFYYPVKDTESGRERIPWDWFPTFYTAPENKGLRDADAWMNEPVMQTGNIAAHYKDVCDGIDGILKKYGYTREGGIYKTDGMHCQKERLETPHTSVAAVKKSYDDRTLIFFCHFGVMAAIVAHFIDVSPVQLWQGFFAAPTSVTALASEERIPGTAFFRVQFFGDTQHLHDGGEPPSASGYFTDVFAD